MNELAARTLIDDAFEHAYDEQQVHRFIQNLLVEPDVKDKDHRSGQMIYKSFREDEPLDKEVAVDPEMLGKVFEKMLDADQRKEKGAFYTPRDVVHYMCRQSLVDHLDTELNVRETPLRNPEPQQGDAFGADTPPQGVLTGEDYNPQVKRAHLEALLRDGTNWIEHDTRMREASTDAERDSLQQRIDEVDAQIDEQVYALYGLKEEEIGIVESNVEE